MLGEGGMGVVYLAEDTRLDRKVAIKFLPKQVAADHETRSRFKVEAKSAAALNHPNIATIYAIEESGDEIFITMEYIDGNELKDKIDSGPLPITDALDIAIQIANGLNTAHQKGIIHRDVKSTNIMLTEKGDVKIMDFGLAKIRGGPELTQSQTTLGTAAYMSPEQFSGEAVDHRSDIWSFGVVLFNMLTGQMPFKGDYEQALMYSILNQKQASITRLRSEVPAELERIVNKTLAKQPDDRYQHADELADDLVALKKQIENGNTQQKPDTAKQSKKLPALRYGSLAALLVLAALLTIYFWPDKRASIDSIAVLPLVNRSGDSEQDHIVDGMTEALITELSKIQALRVKSRTSIMRYKNTEKSLPEIAKELRVGALVEGSAMLIGDQIRVTAQLIDAETDGHLWANSYNRDFREIFSLYQEVARTIAGEIKIKLTPQEEAFLGDPQPIDPKAYELYLRGSQIMYEGGNKLKALKYLEESVAIDPGFVPVYSSLALAYYKLAGYELAVGEAELKARRAASKALQLNDKLPEAHIAMGLVLQLFDYDWAGAEASFRRAIQLQPTNKIAHYEYCWLLMRIGRFEDALAEAETVRILEDPRSPLPIRPVDWIYYFSGQYDLALELHLNRLEVGATDFGPTWDYMCIGLNYLAKGDYKQALTYVEKAISLGKDVNSPEVGYIYAVTGSREKALTVLDYMLKRWQGNESKPYNRTGYFIAWIYAGLGESQEALTYLEQSFEKRHGWLDLLKVQPQLYSLHDEPRFKALLKKMNFEVDE